MRRVLIVGPCGAGKSTLAVKLAQRTGLPLFHMDKLAWKPGWVDSTRDEVLERLAPVVAGERWLIDGSYGSTLAPRLGRADTVVYLDYPVRQCVGRLLRRYWHFRGRSRPDMTEGCPERLDLAFLWYAARWNAGPRKRLEASLAAHSAKVVRLESPAAAELWLTGVGRDMDGAAGRG
jgi:adenylate kinase family enzyme